VTATSRRWLPWLLAVAALALFAVIPDSAGLLLAVVWSGAILAWRGVAGALPDPRSRVWLDLFVMLGLCMAAFEGGWYLLPAGVAFLLNDRTGFGSGPQSGG